MSNSTLGQLIPTEATVSRDAVHVAIISLIAGPEDNLAPGEPFCLSKSGHAISSTLKKAIGVVDPFLKASVRPGERFWGCLFPGSVTGLRHDFDHHAFPPATAEIVERVVEKPEDPEVTEIREYAKSHGLTLREVIKEASTALDDSCRGCY